MSDAEQFFRAATGKLRTGADNDEYPLPGSDPGGNSGPEVQASAGRAGTFTVEWTPDLPWLNAGVRADLKGLLWGQGSQKPVETWLRRGGWDIVAFYRAYHASPDTWGIHFRLDRVLALEVRVEQERLPRVRRRFHGRRTRGPVRGHLRAGHAPRAVSFPHRVRTHARGGCHRPCAVPPVQPVVPGHLPHDTEPRGSPCDRKQVPRGQA